MEQAELKVKLAEFLDAVKNQLPGNHHVALLIWEEGDTDNTDNTDNEIVLSSCRNLWLVQQVAMRIAVRASKGISTTEEVSKDGIRQLSRDD
jgi:hypothetical protein